MKGRLLTLVMMLWAAPALAGYVLDLDHACFRADDSLGYVEVFVGIHRSGLTYSSGEAGRQADFTLILDVRQTGQIVMSDTLEARDVTDTAQTDGQGGKFLVHVFRLLMKSGDYNLRASLFQTRPEPQEVVTSDVTVPVYATGAVMMSGLELGSQMSFNEEESPLVKNGVRLVPNPTRFFGTGLPLLYYYAEAYGMDFDSAVVDSYRVIRRIIDAESNRPVRPETVRTVHTRGPAVVIADGFPVTTLRTGTYYLEIEAQSIRSGHSSNMRKRFWIYRQEDYQAGRPFEPTAGVTAFDARMLEVEPTYLEVVSPDSAILWMRYILTDEESRRVSRLTSDGKRAFVEEYWKTRGPESGRNPNDYFARVVEANRRYTFLKKPGWRTDRGRVFILNGEPDRTQHNYATADLPDHEIWEYDRIEGGVVFVFLDRTGYGDLNLVHSTKRGEIYNTDWPELAPNVRRLPGDIR